MKDDDLKLLRGFEDKQTNRQTDERTYISECRIKSDFLILETNPPLSEGDVFDKLIAILSM